MAEELTRTIGIEKTVQTSQYHPLKVFTYVKDIPFNVWNEPDWILSLWKYLILQSYKALKIEADLRAQLKEVDDVDEYLNALEAELLDNLNLRNLVVNVDVTMNPEHILDGREEEIK